jgi:hypothetical protein
MEIILKKVNGVSISIRTFQQQEDNYVRFGFMFRDSKFQM